MRDLFFGILLGLTLLSPPLGGQLRVRPVADDRSDAGLGLALRRLGTVGTFMMTTAHPDDENNALLAEMRYRHGFRATLVTATRGDGGQNEIGPELFDALAVLRTEELAAAHRFDGAEQFFTRAVDFGYSFSIDETLEKWGKQEILGDYVRHIRALRPDVIVGFVWDGDGGGQHHQTSARLSAEAFRAAADPSQFPDQIRDGLRPWQAKKFYYTAGFGGGPGTRRGASSEGLTVVDGNIYDPLLGRTYDDISSEARSMHKCQGMSQLLRVPGLGGGFGAGPRLYKLHDSTIPGQLSKREPSILDGVDANLTSLVTYAGAQAPMALESALEVVARHGKDAQDAFASSEFPRVASHLSAGLQAVRDLRRRLPSFDVGDQAQFEIDFRLAGEEQDYVDALLLAERVRLEALADDGHVIAGQPLQVTFVVDTQASSDVRVANTTFAGFGTSGEPCPAGTASATRPFVCNATLTVPADAELSELYFRQRTDAARYDFDTDAPFGLPFRPTPFQVTAELVVAGATVQVRLPVQRRTDADIFAGEKRMELQVVPAFAVTVSPEIAIVPVTGALRSAGARRGATEREISVTVTNSRKGAAEGQVSLEVPSGWRISPPSAPVTFSREDESLTVRFTLAPPAEVVPGEFRATAKVASGSSTSSRGFQIVEYPHTRQRLVFKDAAVRVKLMDVRIAPGLTVGYIMGVGDAVPPALAQLGAAVELIDTDTLAWGNLARFDVIMTGVRAYERRADLRAYNQRLLDYAAAGGTVIVQYNKFEFNQAQYGPYPAKVSNGRVTAEDSEFQILMPSSPVFTAPNRIGAADWQGWVQERGLYFLGERDSRYRDLIELEDPFPYNAGIKRGALVEAEVGKGRWYYLGLGLWRQLPAGTNGAYRLMANLISLGKRGRADAGVAARP